MGGALRAELARRYRSDATAGVAHDMKVTSVLNPLSSEVVKVTPTAPYIFDSRMLCNLLFARQARVMVPEGMINSC